MLIKVGVQWLLQLFRHCCQHEELLSSVCELSCAWAMLPIRVSAVIDAELADIVMGANNSMIRARALSNPVNLLVDTASMTVTF